MKDICISIRQVSKWFGREQVLKEITHDFEAGRIHGLVGNNGSGKTVLFKCICGFLRPTEGMILVDYEQVGRDVDFPDNIGLIIETPGFLPNFSGLRNLELLAALRGRIGRSEVRSTMERVGLDPDLKRHVSKYSLGMRQRLGIAQAIMEDPALLILDEPFNGLDHSGVLEIRNLLKELKAGGTTILLASHNARDIEELCDTVCEMDAGILSEVR
ncbi:MAG: ATP-binding cassette domain-containing protein [Clostridia bacterium]|nr:ATP-binding cassette domain-containing protein [Clostridia bacterium]